MHPTSEQVTAATKMNAKAELHETCALRLLTLFRGCAATENSYDSYDSYAYF